MVADKKKWKIGITSGDLNGVGLEVVLKALSDNRLLEMCTPVVYASEASIKFNMKMLDINPISFYKIKRINEAKHNKFNLVKVWDDEAKIEFGIPDKEAGQFAWLSLKTAVADLKENKIDALVTAPIDKSSIQSDEFDFPGHTEYLQTEAGAEESLMFMLGESTKIGVVTNHIPVGEITKELTAEKILKKISLMNKSLKEDFGINRPKIAVLGLNPHAGDNGLLGKEEEKVISPAIQQAKTIDILAFGPFPADGFFGNASYSHFDAVLAMYHDQGLIPAKIYSFGFGVNFTAGLPFVRTSPDHGTAYSIAGQNKASGDSLRSAIYKALDIKDKRLEFECLAERIVVPSKNRK